MLSRASVASKYNALRSDALRNALDEIISTTERNVYIKPTSLRKFGTHDELSATEVETVWEVNSNEEYVSDNLINRAVSSNAADNQTIFYEGHTIDGSGNLTSVTGSLTLNGQTPVAFPGLARHTRAVNRSATELQGDVYFYQSTATVTDGVPQEESLIHNKISGTASPPQQQSQKAATAVSQHDWWIVTNWSTSVRVKQNTSVNFYLEVRDQGGVFRVVSTMACSAGDTQTRIYEPCLIVPPNSDVRVRAIAAASSAEVSSELNGYLANDPFSQGEYA
jgi:hypothetical protein